MLTKREDCIVMQSLTQLPDNSKNFEINVEEGDTTRQRWAGKFECKCVLNLRERAAADILQRKMTEGLGEGLSQETLVYALMIAQLEVRLTSAPDWWLASERGRDLQDLNVIYEIYTKCMEAEKEWREEVWGDEEKEKFPIKSSEENEEDEKPAE